MIVGVIGESSKEFVYRCSGMDLVERADFGDLVGLVCDFGYNSEVVSAAFQGPEEILVLGARCLKNCAVCNNNLICNYIVL